MLAPNEFDADEDVEEEVTVRSLCRRFTRRGLDSATLGRSKSVDDPTNPLVKLFRLGVVVGGCPYPGCNPAAGTAVGGCCCNWFKATDAGFEVPGYGGGELKGNRGDEPPVDEATVVAIVEVTADVVAVVVCK